LRVFSTGTETEEFTEIPGRGRDPKTEIGALFGLVFNPFFQGQVKM